MNQLNNKRFLALGLSVILFLSIAAGCKKTQPVVSHPHETAATISEATPSEATPSEATPSEATPSEATPSEAAKKLSNPKELFRISEIASFSGKPHFAVNDNKPFFTTDEIVSKSFESYSELDKLKRCGTAFACIGEDIMPQKNEKNETGNLKPSGFQTTKYDYIDGKYLYNRCHLIAFSLSGEKANEKNIITGTRYLNNEGMLPFEKKIQEYVLKTHNHVMYRVTPIFEKENLLATGVLLEGYSVEDKGKGINFNVFCYNAQPYVTINYKDGTSKENQPPTTAAPKATAAPKPKATTAPKPKATTAPKPKATTAPKPKATTAPKPKATTAPKPKTPTVQEPANNGNNLSATYILNTNTRKFHYSYCDSVKKMSEKNKQAYSGSREEILRMGYEPCKRCNP